MYINWKRKELIVTLALYGPEGSGKTTTWRYLSQGAAAPPAQDEDTFSLRLKKVQGKRLILNLRDTPGAEDAASYRKVALYGVDGVIFVADSDPARSAANQHTLDELEANLAAMKKSLQTMPLIFQYNKTDLPNALPADTIHALLNPRLLPYEETCATQGQGLVALLKQATDLILRTVV